MDKALLFEQVKRKLNITWDDEDTNARIEEIINAAIPDLKHRLGIFDDSFDFSTADEENMLFLAYCFYEWNHCLNEFDVNYERMIATVRVKHEVAYYKAFEEVEDEDEE